MINKQNIALKNAQNLPVSTDIFRTDVSGKSAPKPLIIFVHGFKGFKDWGGFPYMIERFAGAGFIAVSFNLSHNGVAVESPMEFTRLDLFAENTHTKELDDVILVINYFYENAEKYNIDKNKIALVGHSRGGGDVILAANGNKKIKCIVTLSSIAVTDRYTDEQKKRWREAGYIETPNMRTKQMMRMNKTFLDDIEENHERLNITKAMGSLTIPALIIHGKEDLAVKVTDAEKLYDSSNKNLTKLHLIENTGHTFGTEHPFKGTTKAFDEAIEKTIGFIKDTLI